MAKYELKEQVRKLRKKGFSINEIVKKLQVSKSTVSIWCRDIVLSELQNKNIKIKSLLKTNKGRMIGAEMNKNKRLLAIQLAKDFGENKISKINKKELLFIATALYWSEGSKSDRTSGFQFINSDPEMILIVKKFLTSYMNIEESELVCSVQINGLHKYRISKVLNFWQNLLNLQDNQIRKPYFIETKSKKVYENHDEYYGICRLMVRKSTDLKYRMIGLIQAMKKDILSM